jgi:hypothetical protein
MKGENKSASGGLYFDCRSCPLKGDVRLLIFHKSTVLPSYPCCAVLLPSRRCLLFVSCWCVRTR